MLDTFRGHRFTKRELAELAMVKRVAGDRLGKRVRKECYVVGRIVVRLIKKFGVKWGEKREFCRAVLDSNNDYLQRFVHVYEDVESGLLSLSGDGLADRWAAETGWRGIDSFGYEPMQSNNLVREYKKSLRESTTSAAADRKLFTVSSETDPSVEVLTGNALTIDQWSDLPENHFQMVLFSPPYHGARNYGHPDQLGHETTVNDYIHSLVLVMRQMKRLLRPDGCVWINIGDRISSPARQAIKGWAKDERPAKPADEPPHGSLLHIPHRLVMALKHDGWLNPSEVIWSKTAMAARGDRRPFPLHEMLFMFTQGPGHRYYPDAVRVPVKYKKTLGPKQRRLGRAARHVEYRAVGSVWDIPSVNRSEQRALGMSPFPLRLAEMCIRLSTQPGDAVLDPFGGTGTTGVAAKMLGRRATLIELNREFADSARRRIDATEIMEHYEDPLILAPVVVNDDDEPEIDDPDDEQAAAD